MGLEWEYNRGIIVAHGDKCYGYRDIWNAEGIPFAHGVAMYLLTYCYPFDHEVRQTEERGWVDPYKWVIENYPRYKDLLPEE